MNKYLLLLCASFVLFSQSASATLIGVDTVDGVNSLYTANWGHPYNTGSGGAHSEFNAIGFGHPVRAFEVASSAYGFTSGDNLRITAMGCVVDLGTTCTGPDYFGGTYRALPVYALIGVWSSSATLIAPIDLVSGINPAFTIGALLNIVVPSYSSPLYLFMATNDGDFLDNSGAYQVKIESVPAPSVLWLMMFGLFILRQKARMSHA